LSNSLQLPKKTRSQAVAGIADCTASQQTIATDAK